MSATTTATTTNRYNYYYYCHNTVSTLIKHSSARADVHGRVAEGGLGALAGPAALVSSAV